MKYLIIPVALSILISCQKDVETSYIPQGSLEYHLQSFEDEAALRGIFIDLDHLDLSISIQEIERDNVAGLCHYNSNRPNEIIIDRSFWNSSNDLFREMVVFHELGHCVLARGHRETQDQNGSCLSIMQSGTGTCILRYNQVNRDFYLDELFYPDRF